MPTDLIERCIVARATGADFPTIWRMVLSRHPLVTGMPTQTSTDGRPQLAIQLITGQVLIYDSQTDGYGLWPFSPR